jgi:hypothetical protein
MTPKISAVVSDVDDTLVTDDKILTARTQAAVADLRANGIVFSIITSRPPRGLRMLVKSLGITTPFGGFNGGVLATPERAIIAEHLLSPEIARRAVDMLKACGAEVWLFSGHDWLVGHSDEPYVALEERTVGFPPTIVEDFGAALDTTAKIVGVSADFELLARCERDAMPRSSIKRPSFIRNLTTSTSPTRLQTKASHYPRSRICWLFRWPRSPSSVTAATMSRCSSGLRESPAAAAERIRQFTLIKELLTATMLGTS